MTVTSPAPDRGAAGRPGNGGRALARGAVKAPRLLSLPLPAYRLSPAAMLLPCAFFLASCSGGPESLVAARPDLRGAAGSSQDGDPEAPAPAAVSEPGPASPAAERAVAAGEAGAPGTEALAGDPLPGKDVFYSVAADMKATLPAEEAGPEGEASARVIDRAAGGAEPPPTAQGAGTGAPAKDESGLDSYANQQLIAELEERFSLEWISLSGGIGNSGAEEADPRREEAARRIIALAAIRPPRESGPFAEALSFAMSAGGKAEDKLLAAAYLEMQGRDQEARKLIGGLVSGASPGAPGGEVEGAFQLAGLAFARNIAGPGKFTPAPRSHVAPGKTVLVYGEFRNFLSHREEGGGGKTPTFRRAFSASLKLLSPANEEIDRLDCLPEARGRQSAAAPKEIVNFWVRYRIPSGLKPGKHRIVIEARDVLAEATAESALEFDV